MSTLALHAVARFGLGARPGELAEVSRDPRAWTLDQIARAARAAPAPPNRDVAPKVIRAFGSKDAAQKKEARRAMRRSFADGVNALIAHQAATDLPVFERWVAFWTNHFSISTRGPVLPAVAPAYERNAIRPHALGRFRDMLGAVIGHPAMLLYLDQIRSVGPNSPITQRRPRRGLNENLARELLELHTLGVDGGYAQTDVTELAKILTGWSFKSPRGGGDGSFTFNAEAHEPGAKTLLGRRYEEAGRQEAEQAMDALARHPATARHIATKIARHYVADDPPRAAVARLTEVFQETDGDLRALADATIRLDAAWSNPGAKIRPPHDFVLAATRAAGAKPPAGSLFGSLRALGQRPFSAPTPEGWPDRAADWLSAEGLMRRIEFADAAGRRLRRMDPVSLLDAALGPAADPVTRFHVANAGARATGVAVALASPQMLRR